MDRRRFLISSAAGAFTIPFVNFGCGSAARRDYDFVVVGAGSAGCIVAARLARLLPDASVLLIEAGARVSKTEQSVWDPSMYMATFLSGIPELEWGYVSEPQANLNGRTFALIRGKALGGCAVRNGMIYVRGGKAGFDRWAANGAEGWSYDEVRPHFDGVEAQIGLTSGDTDPLIDSVVAGARQAGFQHTTDYNAQVNPNGFGALQLMIREGRRETTHTGFLEDRHIENLSILTNTTVRQVRIARAAARGVVVQGDGGEVEEIDALREVVLSAGAFGSPQLLMLSGVGDPTQLSVHGLRPLVDLPGVGQNLQDDVIVSDLYVSQQPLPPTPLGVMGVVGFGHPGQSEQTEATMQFTFSSGFIPGVEMWGMSSILLRAESRGTLRLRSGKVEDAPVITLNLLGTDGDWKRLTEAVKISRELANTNALVQWREGVSSETDDEILDHLRQSAGTGLHYAGTCKMGVEPDAVVDPDLRVVGVERLRVADASIIPTTVSGNTAGATMMVAHKGAELVAATHGASVQSA